MSQENYTKLVCDQLEILPPEMIIHRITGDGPIDLMVGLCGVLINGKF